MVLKRRQNLELNSTKAFKQVTNWLIIVSIIDYNSSLWSINMSSGLNHVYFDQTGFEYKVVCTRLNSEGKVRSEKYILYVTPLSQRNISAARVFGNDL